MDTCVGGRPVASPGMRYRWAVRWSVVAMVLAAVLVSARPAAAHTAFESSVPADGDVVDVVVSEVVIRFTGEATPTGEGFTVLDPTGVVRSPSSVATDDNKVFVLAFEPPLAGGPVGVRWVVRAQDAHPIDGSFSFTVTAPPPTTTPPSTVAPTTTATAASTAAPETTVAPEAVSTTTMVTDHGSEAAGVSLDEFLAADASTPGEGRQLVGRIGAYLGVIGAVGGLAFIGFTLRGTRREIDAVLVAVAGLGVLTAIGAGLEYWGWLAQIDGSFFGELTSTPGLAMALRFAGGTIIAGSIVATRQPPPIETAPSDVGAVSLRRWDPRTAPLALAGGALLVGSFWFDGHSVSEGPRVVHAAVNSVHVVAAAVWAAGVAALLGVLVARRRRGGTEPGCGAGGAVLVGRCGLSGGDGARRCRHGGDRPRCTRRAHLDRVGQDAVAQDGRGGSG